MVLVVSGSDFVVPSVVAVSSVEAVVSDPDVCGAKEKLDHAVVVVEMVGWGEGGIVGGVLVVLVFVGLDSGGVGRRVVGEVAELKLVADGVAGAFPAVASIVVPAGGRVAVFPVLAVADVPAGIGLLPPYPCCLLAAGSRWNCLAVVVLSVIAVVSGPVVHCACCCLDHDGLGCLVQSCCCSSCLWLCCSCCSRWFGCCCLY